MFRPLRLCAHSISQNAQYVPLRNKFIEIFLELYINFYFYICHFLMCHWTPKIKNWEFVVPNPPTGDLHDYRDREMRVAYQGRSCVLYKSALLFIIFFFFLPPCLTHVYLFCQNHLFIFSLCYELVSDDGSQQDLFRDHCPDQLIIDLSIT